MAELTPDIALMAGELGASGFRGHPADRIIAATAMHHATELVTKDAAIRGYEGVRTVW